MKCLRILVLIGLIGCLTSSSGCTNDPALPAGPAAGAGQPTLAWPPPPVPLREVSDNAFCLDGIDYTLTSGCTAQDETALQFNGYDELPWAVYSIGSLEEDNELISVSCSFSEQPIRPDDGTEMYFAMANYDLGCWEWISLPLSNDSWFPLADSAGNYISSDGCAHLATVLSGPGKGWVYTVNFTYGGPGQAVAKPRNLTAACETPREVVLNWDPVENAIGYHLYRSLYPDFSSRIRVNLGLIETNTYTDHIETNGDYYFYYVTALSANESNPSNTARVWCMGADLPAPFDLEVVSRVDGGFISGWDWDNPPDGDPYSFTLFLDTAPNFTLESETMRQVSVHGGSRQNTFHEIEPGVVYYWKLCATDQTGNQGRMSDELTGAVPVYWTWSDVATISAGHAPVRIISDGGRIALAYFDDYRVMFAIQNGDDWNVECVMDATLEDRPSFNDHLDLCYSSGRYFIAAHACYAGDCWFAEWDSTDDDNVWTQVRLHGDGLREYDSPKSGFYLVITADDAEVSVVQYYLTEFSLMLHTRDIDGYGWRTQVIRTGYTPGCIPTTSTHYLDGNLYVLTTHDLAEGLFLGDREGGWQWGDVLYSTPPLTKHLDLQRFLGEWITPAKQPIDKDLYLVHGEALPWTAELVPEICEDSGHYARMAVDGPEVIVIEYFDEHYNFALHTENWHLGPIIVPGVSKYLPAADITLMAGRPYLAFEEKLTGLVRVAWGTPPEE